MSEKSSLLIVDDEVHILSAIKRLLYNEPYQVFTAQGGREALSILEKETITLMISDQNMPEIDGIDLFQKAQVSSPDTIRIAMTASHDLEDIKNLINKGKIFHFIFKPWDPVTLIQSIKTGIENGHLIKKNRELQALLQKQHDALQKEMQIGGKIHELMLMGSPPKDCLSAEIDTMTIASKEIDGDFYDFYNPTKECLDLVIGDVMGKGLPAALVGTALKSQLMRFANPLSQTYEKKLSWQKALFSPQEILTKAHMELAHKLIELGYFVSLFYGRFNFTKKVLSFVECGLTKPLHYSYKKEIATYLSGDNFPLGMVEAAEYQECHTPFAIDDLFVFYSDGITETKNPQGDLFGSDRLKEIIEKEAKNSASSVLSAIKRALFLFTNKLYFDDDCTLIIVKIKEHIQNDQALSKTAHFIGDLNQLDLVRNFIQSFCLQLPGDTQLIANQLQLAINEAFCNIVKHGYGEDNQENIRQNKITIDISYQRGGILIKLFDQGQIFNPQTLVPPNFTGEKDGGFGMHIIDTIADQLSYETKKTADGWNCLQIFKQIEEEETPMQISHTTQDDILIVSLDFENLDANGSQQFKEHVLDLITKENKTHLIFDLKQLAFIDSSGLGSFLSILRHLNTQGGDLKLVHMQPSIRSLFEIVRMHKLFEIFNHSQEALNSYQ